MQNKICVYCKKRATDKHHIKTRGSGGSDEPYNLIDLCRNCHQAVHLKGLNWFAQNPRIKNYLLAHGWEFLENIEKWRHF